AIHSEDELNLLLDRVPRVVLVLFDRPEGQPTHVQVRIWEIWPRSRRNQHFATFIKDYFVNNYQAKIRAGLRPAPCNLHPLKYAFYLMNPIPTFRATVEERDGEASIVFHLRVPPDADRGALPSEPMPTSSC